MTAESTLSPYQNMTASSTGVSQFGDYQPMQQGNNINLGKQLSSLYNNTIQSMRKLSVDPKMMLVGFVNGRECSILCLQQNIMQHNADGHSISPSMDQLAGRNDGYVLHNKAFMSQHDIRAQLSKDSDCECYRKECFVSPALYSARVIISFHIACK